MFQLTKDQMDRYRKDGVTGPVRAISSRSAGNILSDMSVINDDLSPIFGVRTNRDRHLFVGSLFDLATCHSIVSAIRNILGDDIVLFRSDFFKKIPTVGTAKDIAGGGARQGVYDTRFEYLHWHQGTNFSSAEGIPSVGRPKMEGERYRDYYETIPTTITVWVSLTSSFPLNGAVQYWRGSGKIGAFKFRKCDVGQGLGGSDVELDIKPPEEECVTFCTKPGECIIFNDKVVHRSACNMTERSRVGVGFRYARSDVDIYPDMDFDPYGLPLHNWGVVPVSGNVINQKLRIAKLDFLN